jgi:hypothetical protein
VCYAYERMPRTIILGGEPKSTNHLYKTSPSLRGLYVTAEGKALKEDYAGRRNRSGRMSRSSATSRSSSAYISAITAVATGTISTSSRWMLFRGSSSRTTARSRGARNHAHRQRAPANRDHRVAPPLRRSRRGLRPPAPASHRLPLGVRTDDELESPMSGKKFRVRTKYWAPRLGWTALGPGIGSLEGNAPCGTASGALR